MHICPKILLLLTCAFSNYLPQVVRAGDAPLRVSCVGDSITAGAGASSGHAYPAQLQEILGSGYQVENDGVSGRTLLNQGDHPYQKEQALQNALKLQPNIVVIMLGTNDTKPQNWKFKDEFVGDYKNLIEKFKVLDSHPKIYICLPVPVTGPGNYGINEVGIEAETPMIQSVAQDEQVSIIDLHAPFNGKDADFPDHVHPNDAGAQVMAQTVAKAITAKD